ncbi:carbohydrate kinase family protein [uncultured Thermanaerothrix sp.]|uniref:carbohydrate kinase family protein n=1 Tax=uncultured Thermanaerothrix sp. TaxID=1195149 RepID=UPI00261C0DEC|nr:carbohydrate kinase family protein [uncultured Thermanaerothrix sp.]
MKHPRVALLGDLNIDTLLTISRFPQPGWDGLAETASVQIGGTVVNTAVVLRRLGVDCALLGSIGRDLWGDYLCQALQPLEIDLRGVVKQPSCMTGLTFIAVTPDGERTMFSYRGANTAFAPHHLNTEVLRSADLVHLSGYALLAPPQRETAFAALSQAEAVSLPICLDSGLQPVMDAPDVFESVLSRVSVGILGMAEVAYLSGYRHPEEALDWLLGLGMTWAALKMGSEGCWLADHEHRIYLPAFPVNVRDTTGAGDSFTAGVICGYVHGLGLAPTAVLANALGALATRVYGAGLALPGPEVLFPYLQEIAPLTDWLPYEGAITTLKRFLVSLEDILPTSQEGWS